MNDFLTIDFTMGLLYFFDNSTTDDEPATGNKSVVTTTTASMETTMELPTIGIFIKITHFN